jgi:2-C-methyl-D-erythritol 4-phosphate cytidylyltransferase/2-C-methyl-D-erythritol 2,4-cyclodiphosphate synthase
MAAGAGRRFGRSLPKQFCRIDGDLPIRRSVRLFLSSSAIDAVVCVIPAGFEGLCNESLATIDDARLLRPVIGGPTRAMSVGLGLKAIDPLSPDFVLIHDAVRHSCTHSIIGEVIRNLRAGAEAVVPCVPATDSVRIRGGSVRKRDVDLIQTPQGFRFDMIRRLHERYEGLEADDDSSLCDLAGVTVTLIAGDRMNRKITFEEDSLSIRTGFGFDVHRFSQDDARKLYLMGVCIDGFRGLEAVSDGDVAIHSVVDGILGALAAGSIGEHFPETDSKWLGVSSRIFLKYCNGLLLQRRASVINIDVTIVCESPRISNYSDSMRGALSEDLDIDVSQVNVKGKTTEGLGFIGANEGISAYSIVTLRA